jgi:hypothetical protein
MSVEIGRLVLGRKRLKPEATRLLEETLVRGEIERGEASRITGPVRAAQRFGHDGSGARYGQSGEAMRTPGLRVGWAGEIGGELITKANVVIRQAVRMLLLLASEITFGVLWSALRTFWQGQQIVIPLAIGVCPQVSRTAVAWVHDADVGSFTSGDDEKRVRVSVDARNDLVARPLPAGTAKLRNVFVGAFAIGLIDACDLNIRHV